jgi:RNA polymerase sigma-70 factor (ECF subfamily)
MIHGAASGRDADRQAFALRYAPVVRAYLRARWAGTPRVQDVDDAVQDVLLECIRVALERVEEGRPGGFRAFLYGVVRNVALMAERRGARRRDAPGAVPFEPDARATDEESLGAAFDRAWALDVIRRARRLQREVAEKDGEDARRRIELLRLRFQEGLPVREIAMRWGGEPARVHREYAKARREFRRALLEVVAFEHPGEPAEVERECARLLDLFE